MTLAELIEQAKKATYTFEGREYPARGAHVNLSNGTKIGVSLIIPTGRTRSLRMHFRVNFYVNQKRVSREVAERALAEDK